MVNRVRRKQIIQGKVRQTRFMPKVLKTVHPRSPRKPSFSSFKRSYPVKVHEEREDDGTIRLSKQMSILGICSRREADVFIANGQVLVNGEVVDTLGHRVNPDDSIELSEDAQKHQSDKVTFILHKPLGVVSGQAEKNYIPASTLLTRDNRWVNDIRRPFRQQYLEKLAPAGRLDLESTGLLVLSQDGRIVRQIIAENSDIEKEYIVSVEGDVTEDKLQKLRHGLTLDGVELEPAIVEVLNSALGQARQVTRLQFILKQGRKRQIRRMCELVKLKVLALKRIRIGKIKLETLPYGKWRFLRSEESF